MPSENGKNHQQINVAKQLGENSRNISKTS